LAPTGAKTAKGLLWFSVFLWIMLFVVFPLSATVTTGEGEDAFPVGIITVLPAYIGFCLAIYVTGAAYAAWSKDNKVECILIIGLGWAAFAMFLLLPAVINSWNLGAENPDVDWDSVVWWLRFGSLFPAIAPWLIVVGLYFVNTRNIALLEEEVKWDGKLHYVDDTAAATDADSCTSCGGSLTVHPKTLEVFCAACGWGLKAEAEAAPIVVDATPAPTHTDQMFVEQAPPDDLGFCGDCGTKLSILTKTQQVFCPGCGAGLPTTQSQGPAQETTSHDPSPSPAPAPPKAPTSMSAPTSSFAPPVQAPPSAVQPPAPAPAPTPEAAPAPAPPPGQTTAQSPSPPPTETQPERSPGKCPICGAMLAVHPRTGERFCPACGAGLRSDK
jgi:predicted RNA-binding Zn-ribbon protein involved in translation (DUF1610 family)